MNQKPILVFSTQSYKYFVETEAWMDPRFETGRIEFKKFPDGETYHDILNDVRNRTVCIVGGMENAESTMELYDMACHVAKHRPKELIVCIPYYGYSTMERAVKDGEIVKAKSRARMLSSIPSSGRGNTFMFLDLHSEGIPHYLEGNATPVHLYAKQEVMAACYGLGRTDFTLGSTDAGRAKWVESLAKDMGVECAIIIKRRTSGSETDVIGINADVKGKHVIIYDDMIRTGGSIINAAKAYREAGAKKVSVVSTHGVFKADDQGIETVIGKLLSNGLDKVVITNSHPHAIRDDLSLNLPADLKRVEVIDVSSVFTNKLISYYNNE